MNRSLDNGADVTKPNQAKKKGYEDSHVSQRQVKRFIRG